MASNTEKMIALLRAIKVDTNGAVVGAMESRGMKYALSYGVALPTIRQNAKAYFPDTQLAKFLYRQQVRELRLAALYVADPSELTLDDADFWAENLETTEIADVVAMKLFSSAENAWDFAYHFLDSEDALKCYLSLMTGMRLLNEDSLAYLAVIGDVVKHKDSFINIALEKIENKFDMMMSFSAED